MQLLNVEMRIGLMSRVHQNRRHAMKSAILTNVNIFVKIFS